MKVLFQCKLKLNFLENTYIKGEIFTNRIIKSSVVPLPSARWRGFGIGGVCRSGIVFQLKFETE